MTLSDPVHKKFNLQRTGLAAANIVFTCLPIIHAWAAMKGGAL